MDAIAWEEFELGDRVVAKITFLEDGAVSYAWEEGSWMYQAHGYQVDPDDLVAIARSMS